MARTGTHYVVVAEATDPRAAGLSAALAGRPVAVHWLSYTTLLDHGSELLRQHLRPGDILRLDSPGRDPAVAARFLARGAAKAPSTGNQRKPAEQGELLHFRQWYQGFSSLLAEVQTCLEGSGVIYTAHPQEIALAFDKPATLALLAAAGIPTPPPLGVVESFSHLRREMYTRGRRRVFLKPCHGFSASGVVAYEIGPSGEQAFTTVESSEVDGKLRLWNTRRLRRLRDGREIARLVDALADYGLWAEAWVPKAGVAGKSCDLRILMIAGRRAHTVLRASRGPITNLHLLNERGDADLLRRRMSPEAWQALEETCTKVAACFPRSLYLGLDVAVSSDFRHHVVFEVNAFGDLLHGIRHQGKTTWELELEATYAGGRWQI